MAPSFSVSCIQGLQIMFLSTSTLQIWDCSQGAWPHISRFCLGNRAAGWGEKAIWNNLLLQSTVVSQITSVPFRRQPGSLWTWSRGKLAYHLDRLNVWQEAKWGSRSEVFDTIPQLKFLKVCVVSNTLIAEIQIFIYFLSCYRPVFSLVPWFPGCDLWTASLPLAHRFPPCL